MKQLIKILIVLLVSIALMSMTSGCSDTKEINGVTYDTYGLFNKDEVKNPNIQYKLVIGNIVWSVILFETIVAPIYFLGFDMYEPVGPKSKDTPIGAINSQNI